jgi:hypothetical protein
MLVRVLQQRRLLLLQRRLLLQLLLLRLWQLAVMHPLWLGFFTEVVCKPLPRAGAIGVGCLAGISHEVRQKEVVAEACVPGGKGRGRGVREQRLRWHGFR